MSRRKFPDVKIELLACASFQGLLLDLSGIPGLACTKLGNKTDSKSGAFVTVQENRLCPRLSWQRLTIVPKLAWFST